jgi:ABC-type oligopeptide transport system ATPase subunit
MPRDFQTLDAAEAFAANGAPLMLGMVGPSGSGKTYSALRVATGIQKVSGGDIFVVDTEQRRSLHYASQFRFKHVDFQPPYGSLDYLEALRYCKKQGAGVLIVDSCSHEHTGPGGLLEQHEAEVDRMAGNDYAKRDRVSIGAWAKPKAGQRKLITAITTELAMPVIFCFRAKTGTKPAPKGASDRSPIEMGYSTIGDDAWLFEMAVNFLFLPSSDGVPTWQSNFPGERMAIKCPAQHRWLYDIKGPVNEDVGRRLAEWARGSGVVTKAAQGEPEKPRFEAVDSGPPHDIPALPTDPVAWAEAVDKAIMAATDPAWLKTWFVERMSDPQWGELKGLDEAKAKGLHAQEAAMRKALTAKLAEPK